MGEQPLKEPLLPTYKTARPSWLGLWSGREYKGRPDWWREMGYKDDWVRSGKFRIVGCRFREEDPEWWDRKVEDGTSLAGPFGLDSKRHRDLTTKGDTPGPLPEFQDKVYRGSHQYKQIAAKWELSKEHPGFPISPALTDYMKIPKHLIGQNGIIPTHWAMWAPRFFDKPLNEAPFEKGLACLKLTLFSMLGATMIDIRSFNSVPPSKFRPRTFFKRYFELTPVPAALAFTWGLSMSVSAAVRNKDDVYNHYVASAAVGSVYGAMRNNFPLGLSLSLASLVLGMFWQYARVSDLGLQSIVTHQQSGGIWGGPFVWKFFNRGDIEVPTIKY